LQFNQNQFLSGSVSLFGIPEGEDFDEGYRPSLMGNCLIYFKLAHARFTGGLMAGASLSRGCQEILGFGSRTP